MWTVPKECQLGPRGRGEFVSIRFFLFYLRRLLLLLAAYLPYLSMNASVVPYNLSTLGPCLPSLAFFVWPSLCPLLPRASPCLVGYPPDRILHTLHGRATAGSNTPASVLSCCTASPDVWPGTSALPLCLFASCLVPLPVLPSGPASNPVGAAEGKGSGRDRHCDTMSHNGCLLCLACCDRHKKPFPLSQNSSYLHTTTSTVWCSTHAFFPPRPSLPPASIHPFVPSVCPPSSINHAESDEARAPGTTHPMNCLPVEPGQSDWNFDLHFPLSLSRSPSLTLSHGVFLGTCRHWCHVSQILHVLLPKTTGPHACQKDALARCASD
ncbi:hypothetical protein B0T19DRAFT_146507 [Cercophora scortea]|uniref:Uncharacterized protein n=1 Tax=Cercophora scortea TaxID=314031 RepID=A0AAE0IZF5_9PEZI|nr:hypothetical protein B0T19DRAFT_146507 [Cercophora scortea]